MYLRAGLQIFAIDLYTDKYKMNADLMQKYLLETRDILFSKSLNCPAQLLPVSNELDSQSDQFERLNFTEPAQMQAYKDLREVVLPGQPRTILIEFLLERYEPGIIEDCQGQPELALKQLGLWVDCHGRRTKLEHVIGFFDSLQLLWKLALLVKGSLNYSEEKFKMSQELIMYICKDQKELFAPTARLFPMNFPQAQDPQELYADKELVNQHFKEEIGQLSKFLTDTEQKLNEINAQDYTNLSGELGMASLEDLRVLRESLGFLKAQIVEFDSAWEDGFSCELAKVPTQDTSLRNDLGEHVRAGLQQRQILAERIQKIQEIQGQMNQLNADLEQLSQIGNGQKSLVSQDAVLNLVQQVKQLKLANTCAENYPKIY